MPKVEISFGEYFDKWSILQIKARNLQKKDQLKRVEIEMDLYVEDIELMSADSRAAQLLSELYEINLRIWQLMDQLYGINDTDYANYVGLTLEITDWNKRRAFKKGEIDQHFNSTIREAKGYF